MDEPGFFGGKLGTVLRYQDSGSVDAAFVEVSGSHNFYSNIMAINVNPNVSIIPAINSYVYKRGAVTGGGYGYSYSNLNTVYFLIGPNSYKVLTNLAEVANMNSAEGDSGGLMYVLTDNGIKYSVVGVVVGGGKHETTGYHHTYATKHSFLPWGITIIS